MHAETFESQLAPGVYVIGDACIAGAMPKAASAAQSQALRCAAAIARELGVTLAQPDAPALSSLCYSLLGPAAAFAIRARFRIGPQGIEALDPGTAGPPEGGDNAAEAAAWYRRIRADCFAA